MQDAFESIDRTLSGLTAEARATGEVGAGRGGKSFSRAASRKLGDLDLLASDEWPGVPADAVLLQPDKCRTVWKQFCIESSRAVSQAVAVQVKCLRCANRPHCRMWTYAAHATAWSVHSNGACKAAMISKELPLTAFPHHIG